MMDLERGMFRIQYIDFLGKYGVQKFLGPWPIDNWSPTVYLASSHSACVDWVNKTVAESAPAFLAAKELELKRRKKAKQDEFVSMTALGLLYNAELDQWFDPRNMDAA